MVVGVVPILKYVKRLKYVSRYLLITFVYPPDCKLQADVILGEVLACFKSSTKKELIKILSLPERMEDGNPGDVPSLW